MVADGTWLDLRYLPSVHPKFREHLPFGFWPYALAQRLSDWGPVALGWLTSLATLGLVARRSLLAALFLGTTASFFELAATVRLDQLLVLATTAGGLALLENNHPRRAWLVAAACAAAGVAVKGPFGLVPIAAITLARVVAERRPQLFLPALGVAVLAVAGPGLFLWHSWREGGDWYPGYVEAQLVASALGARTDGAPSALEPWLTLGRRFWPWLPLSLWALWQSFRRPELRVLAGSIVLMLLALGLPGRKVWNHALLVFPFLSLWLAQSLEPVRLEAFARPAAKVLAAATALGLVVALGMRPRLGTCVVSPEAVTYSRSHGPEALAVVKPKEGGSPWKPLAVLAGEYGTVPRLVASLDDAALGGSTAVLTRDDAPGWSCDETRGWRLCTRSPW
jgi:4-amino-4-deoxy-L-arabinose transferase-like glycosyltransferase